MNVWLEKKAKTNACRREKEREKSKLRFSLGREREGGKEQGG